jgi:putative transposase
VWHIMSHGNNCDLVGSEDDRQELIELFGRAAQRFGWIVFAYAVMSNHYHLVLKTPQMTLSRGMHWLNGIWASRFNRRYQRRGHLFEGRFKAILIEEQNYLLTAARYVALNPVKAGRVARPEESRWTSYRTTAGYEKAPEWLAVERLLDHFEPDARTSQQRYRDFVDEKVSKPRSPFDKVVAGLYLGSRSWIDSMRPRLESGLRSDDHPAAQRHAGRPEMAPILSAIATTCELPAEAIRNGHGGEERMLAAWLGCHEGLLTRRQIAAGLRLRSSGHASDLIHAFDAALDRDVRLRQTVDRCCLLLRGSPVSLPTAARSDHS